MNKNKSLFVVAVMLITVVCLGTFNSAFAEKADITNGQIDQIRSNCVSIKNTLNRLHVSDALLRVNMGQVFESISTKLMSGFNGRVINNNLNASELVSVFANYNDTLDKFRADYIIYEEKLSAAIEVDCLKQPVAFYDAVAQARDKRTVVRNNIESLAGEIDVYSEAVDNILTKHFSEKGN